MHIRLRTLFGTDWYHLSVQPLDLSNVFLTFMTYKLIQRYQYHVLKKIQIPNVFWKINKLRFIVDLQVEASKVMFVRSRTKVLEHAWMKPFRTLCLARQRLLALYSFNQVNTKTFQAFGCISKLLSGTLCFRCRTEQCSGAVEAVWESTFWRIYLIQETRVDLDQSTDWGGALIKPLAKDILLVSCCTMTFWYYWVFSSYSFKNPSFARCRRI